MRLLCNSRQSTPYCYNFAILPSYYNLMAEFEFWLIELYYLELITILKRLRFLAIFLFETVKGCFRYAVGYVHDGILLLGLEYLPSLLPPLIYPPSILAFLRLAFGKGSWYLLYFILFIIKILFVWQKWGEHPHEEGRGQREREQQAAGWAGSPTPGSVLGPQDHDVSQKLTLNRPSHPGAPDPGILERTQILCGTQ